jgi:hypothetical protein
MAEAEIKWFEAKLNIAKTASIGILTKEVIKQP